MKTVTSLLLALFFCLNAPIMAQQTQMYSAQGYPYKNLIHKADSVKIIYRESPKGINCRVQIIWGQKSMESQNIWVEHKDFNAKPLASCLKRTEAKSVLAKTYVKEQNNVFTKTNGL